MTESTLWQWLKQARADFGSNLHMRRVENGISVGDPDVDGVLNGNDFTAELKACSTPARGTTNLKFHKITPAQVDWHEARLAAGGASCILLQVGRERFVIHGRFVARMAEGVSLDWVQLYSTHVVSPRAAILTATQQRNP